MGVQAHKQNKKKFKNVTNFSDNLSKNLDTIFMKLDTYISLHPVLHMSGFELILPCPQNSVNRTLMECHN